MIDGADALEGGTVGFAGGDFGVSGVVRSGRRGKIGRHGERLAFVGYAGIGRDRGTAAHFGDRCGELFFREGLAVPIEFIGDQAEAVAFDGAGDDGLRLAFGGLGAIEGGEDGGDVMTVNDLGIEAFGFEFQAIAFHIVLVHGGFALAEAVDISDDGEIIEIVVRGEGGGFPDLAFG